MTIYFVCLSMSLYSCIVSESNKFSSSYFNVSIVAAFFAFSHQQADRSKLDTFTGRIFTVYTYIHINFIHPHTEFDVCSKRIQLLIRCDSHRRHQDSRRTTSKSQMTVSLTILCGGCTAWCTACRSSPFFFSLSLEAYCS